jgi:hypothetical protein
VTSETYTKIKESEVAKKVGSGLSTAYQKTKENVQNPELLKENVKNLYQGAKDSVNKGIEKVKDPEFRNEMKEGFKKGVDSVKKSTGEMMDHVSNRFIDPPPQGYNRSNYQDLNQENEDNDSPFDVMSDDEEEQEQHNTEEGNVLNKKKLEEKDDDSEKEEEDVPLISEVPENERKEFTPQPLDK